MHLFLLAGTSAYASTLAGDFVTIDYNSGGTWNDSAVGAGFRARLGDEWTEFVYAGETYQMWSASYSVEGESINVYANSALGNRIIVLDVADDSSNGKLALEATYDSGTLEITKLEWFDEAGMAVGVQFTLSNTSLQDVEDLRLIFAADPDPDAVYSGNYSTVNDVRDADGNGVEDWVEGSGPDSGATIGFLACDPASVALGFWADWANTTDADPALTDPARASADAAMGLRWSASGSLPSGAAMAFRFVVGVGSSGTSALQNAEDLAATACCDGDGDGQDSLACGGADCDDARPDLHPGATDTPYDGIDQDCSGADTHDVDGDGETAVEAGGRDCDDSDVREWSGAAEVWYDGLDQDCDGNDDDQDLDGYVLAYDCDDLDPSIYDNCPEPEPDSNEAVHADAGCGCNAGTSGAGMAGVLAVLGGVRRRATKPRTS